MVYGPRAAVNAGHARTCHGARYAAPLIREVQGKQAGECGLPRGGAATRAHGNLAILRGVDGAAVEVQVGAAGREVDVWVRVPSSPGQLIWKTVKSVPAVPPSASSESQIRVWRLPPKILLS
jgi:hypothetical protein